MHESTHVCIYVDRHMNLYICLDGYREICMNICMDRWIWAELHEYMYVSCMYVHVYRYIQE